MMNMAKGIERERQKLIYDYLTKKEIRLRWVKN
jgi:hypothetical protein